jgi:hypothetical protein
MLKIATVLGGIGPTRVAATVAEWVNRLAGRQHEQTLNIVLDQVVSWGTALKPVRK